MLQLVLTIGTMGSCPAQIDDMTSPETLHEILSTVPGLHKETVDFLLGETL